jgi:Ser/Thr protein kinase RdoA (MazF antagonist)
MIKVKTEQKPKHATMVKKLGGRQDCCHLIEDGAASVGAELGHMEDTGKE